MVLPPSFVASSFHELACAALPAFLTYSLHAALWTLAAALLERWPSLPSRTRSSLWRVAVLAPIVTASVALFLPRGLATTSAPGVRVAWARQSLPLADGIFSANLPWGALGWIALGGVLAGVLRWLLLALLFSRRLRKRTVVTEPRSLERLERLRLRTRLASVRLTQSAGVASPLVLGSGEICLPVGLLSLGNAELDSVLAHELAHLERRDGVWFPLVGFVADALWLQPLCGWAAARFRDSAEQACDDRAIELTRDARALAQVLLQLASSASARGARVLAPSMLNAKRALRTRIRRLVDASSSHPAPAPRYRVLTVAFGLALLAAASSGLSVRIALARGLLPASASHLARQASSSSRVRLLEAQQELRHLLATEQWLAEQPLEAHSSWQQRGNGRQP